MLAEGCRRAERGRRLTVWFVVGTVLPDLLTRPFSITVPDLFWWTMPLHTPVGIVLACGLISRMLRPPQDRCAVFANLLAGAALHLLLDLLQRHIGIGYQLLFPLSWSSFEFGVMWPETTLYLLPLWLGIAVYWIVVGLRARGPAREPSRLSHSR
jgi:hypothetical protein